MIFITDILCTTCVLYYKSDRSLGVQSAPYSYNCNVCAYYTYVLLVRSLLQSYVNEITDVVNVFDGIKYDKFILFRCIIPSFCC